MNDLVNLIYVRCVKGRGVRTMFPRNVKASSVVCFWYQAELVCPQHRKPNSPSEGVCRRAPASLYGAKQRGGLFFDRVHLQRENLVWSLSWEDPLEEGMATLSCTLARRIPRTGEPGGPQSAGSHRVGHDRVTNIRAQAEDGQLVRRHLDFLLASREWFLKMMFLKRSGFPSPLLADWWWANKGKGLSTFLFQPVWGPYACGQRGLTNVSHGRDLSFCSTTQSCVSHHYLDPFGRNEGSYDCIVLIISCWSLFFGTGRRLGHGRLFSTHEEEGTWGDLVPGRALQGSAQVHSHRFFGIPQPRGHQG